jgi:hypothetical protein
MNTQNMVSYYITILGVVHLSMKAKGVARADFLKTFTIYYIVVYVSTIVYKILYGSTPGFIFRPGMMFSSGLVAACNLFGEKITGN